MRNEKTYKVQSIPMTTASIFRHIPVYRYADALLMMAEIENGLNNPCASYINEVRKRAYGDTFEENKYTEGSLYAENELAILQERDKEFVSEGKRWFDVLRMHDASGRFFGLFCQCQLSGHKILSLGTEEAYKMLWPVNIGTLNVNPPPLINSNSGIREIKN